MTRIFLLLIAIAVFSGNSAYSQLNQGNDNEPVVLLKKKYISFWTRRYISDIKFSAIRSSTQEPAIRVELRSPGGPAFPIIRVDSIVLKGDKDMLKINNPLSDTVYHKMNGDLILTSVHYLSPASIKFLKQERVKNIIFIVNGKPLAVHIRDKSQKKLVAMAADWY